MTQYRFRATCPCGATVDHEVQTERHFRDMAMAWDKEHRKHWTQKPLEVRGTPLPPLPATLPGPSWPLPKPGP